MAKAGGISTVPEKIYRLRIACGDGNPIETDITAKTGIEAQDKARSMHPGARLVHVLGSSLHEKIKHDNIYQQVFDFEPEEEVETPLIDRDEQIKTCLTMRSSGHSHAAIAGFLNVGKSTVGRWLKQYG